MNGMGRHVLTFISVALLVAFAALVLASQGFRASEGTNSDAFWSAVHVNGLQSETYPTLRQMTEGADVVLIARMKEVGLGREVRDLDAEALGIPRVEASVFFAHATLVAEAGLSMDEPTELRLQVLLPNLGVMALLESSLPTERGIYFLRDMGARARTLGWPAQLQSQLQGIYDLVSNQGLLRDIGGRTQPPPHSDSPFLLELRGRPFDDVITVVKGWL